MLGVAGLFLGVWAACACSWFIASDDEAARELVDGVLLVGSMAASVIAAGWLTGLAVGGFAHTVATVLVGFLGGYPTALFLSERDGSRSWLLSRDRQG